jgi:DNA-directed RNA polymerase subunit M/transcription elongation factor TFIIS
MSCSLEMPQFAAFLTELVNIGAVACPSCAYPQAYFKEIQTRSADEPATLFFKCAKCEFQWKEG